MDTIFIPGWVSVLPIIATIDLLKYRPIIVIQSGVDPQKVVAPSLAEMFLAIGLASTTTFGAVYRVGCNG